MRVRPYRLLVLVVILTFLPLGPATSAAANAAGLLPLDASFDHGPSLERDQQLQVPSARREGSPEHGANQRPEVHTIFPTGVFPDDVINVQAVVNDLGLRGVDGTIILEARSEAGSPTSFNFGEGDYFAGQRGYVDVLSNSHIFGRDTGDITFLGIQEADARTSVAGGFLSIASWRNTRFEVKGIRFEGAEGAPILVFRANSAEVKNNEIADVHGDPFGMGTFGEPKAVGIWVAANLAALDNITGHIEIKNNLIVDVVADSADGIAVVATNATFEISGNEIRNVNRAGVLTAFSQKPVVIEKNLIVPGPGNTPSSVGNDAGVGIYSSFPIGGEGTIRVEKNRIICENAKASGIALEGGRHPVFDQLGIDMPIADSVFSKNHITMANTTLGGIEIGAVDGPGFHGNVVEKNVIDGSGLRAIYVGGFATGSPGAAEPIVDNNLFKENKLAGFIAGSWDVILDSYTESNVYYGRNETVLDLGTGNSVFLDVGS